MPNSRVVTYWAVGIGLTAGFVMFHDHGWRGSVHLHTLMEAVATLLALMVGAMALVRYYTRKDITFLFIGAGFLGTVFLDGYHTLVTSQFFRPYMPSDLPSLIPWSWVASRQFLSILMFLSLLAWQREKRLGEAARISENTVYLFTAVFTLLSILFFAFVPLPRAYYPEIVFHRPEEFGPALFFLLALVGYLRKGEWRRNTFEHWLVLSLIIGFVGQAVFMSVSGGLFDVEFDAAHTLKKVSYVCVLTGLLISMHAIFRREEESGQRIRAVVDNILDGIITINERGVNQSVNPAVERIFGYRADDMVGRNVRLLAPEPDRGAHDGYIANYVKTGEAKIIGIDREVEGKRRDEKTFALELSVTELELTDERLFLGVVRDITERKAIERMKNEFISTVSHELRTPLTSIRGSLGMIKSGKLGELPRNMQRMVDLAQKNTGRLIDLVNDLLDMEKIHSGSLVFEFCELDASALVEQVLEANRPFAEECGVEFVLTETVPGARITGDMKRLTQVLANLLSNAAKFSPKGEKVEVSVVRNDAMLRISVIDHGPGIPQDFRDRIFERFTQVDASDTRQKGGTGLGLNISRAIVKKHGGRIDYQSEVGNGATFYFDLPELREEEGMDRGTEESPSPAAAGAVPSGARVLIVEDDRDIARLLSLMLTQNGFNADVAYDAARAKELLSEKRYQVMTVDVMLPDQDEISLIRELRLREDTKDLAIIVLSAKAERTRQEVVTSAMGVIDWIDSPIDETRLLAAVKRVARVRGNGKSRLLYVEDDGDLVSMMTSLFAGTAEVVPALTLRHAKERLRNEIFDLVIVDIGLPDGSGLELLPLLKNGDKPTTPVIIFSAEEVDGKISRQVEAALVKSRTSNEELLSTIRSLIGTGIEREEEERTPS